MRPHKLILKAFGPFAKETVIDFDAMGNNIYLITGPTGSGKTTIFDGIVYALFGTASGEGRSRLKTESLHSDFAQSADHKDEMRVEFAFSNAGRTFTVTRRVYWGASGTAKMALRESILTEGEKLIAADQYSEEKSAVTQKITEILGLDAEQFKRIIMLAQGEFQKFLESDSEKRGKILGKLYDNRAHQDLQFRLKAASNLIDGKLKELAGQGGAQVQLLVLPEDLDPLKKQKLSYDNAELIPTLSEINSEMADALGALTEEIEKRNSELKVLSENKTRAEEHNSLLDSLSERRRQKKSLDEQKDAYDLLRKKLSKALSAEKVIPYETAKNNAVSDWEEVIRSIGMLKEEKESLQKNLTALKASEADLKEKLQPTIDELNEKASKIRNILHFYDDLTESLTEYKALKDEADNAEKACLELEKQLTGKKNEQTRLNGVIERLENAGDAAVMNAEQARKSLTDRKKSLEDIRKEVKAVLEMISEATLLKTTWTEAAKAAINAEKEHLRVYNAFVKGQSGLLAKGMAERLQTEESVTCPVCGSVHTKADIGNFAASLNEDIPDQKAVSDAQEARNTAEARAQKAENDYNAKKTAIDGEKKNILRASEDLMGITEWDDLSDGKAISEALSLCEEKIQDASEKYEAAVSERDEKKEAVNKKTELDSEVSLDEENLKKLREDTADKKTRAESAGTSVENWKRQLKGYPQEKSEADTELNELEENVNKLNGQIKKAEDDVASCINAQNGNDGKLNQAENDKVRRESAKDTAVSDYEDMLSENSFTDEAAYHEALSPDGKLLGVKEISGWIQNNNEKLSSYDREVSDTESAIAQLVESTKGFERVDTGELTEQINGLSMVIAGKAKEEKILGSAVQTNEKIYCELVKILNEKKIYLKAQNKIKPLSDAANDKLSFGRYVLGDFFQRVIDQANVHFEEMTDGEFCLVSGADRDKRSAQGLGLRVLNTITGFERDTVSLSGGQLFEASLSLALGLSDIVQMDSASAIQIDSIFIDEGFGRLDGDRLNKAVGVLNSISDGKRQIGIISHVAQLEEVLEKKIHVYSGDGGSYVRIETDE